MPPGQRALYPVLPLRDIVVFPHMIVPLFVGREKSVRALEEVMQDDKQILLSSQIDPAMDDPTRRHLPRRRAGQRAAASETARRHREGAGRGPARACDRPNSSRTTISSRRRPWSSTRTSATPAIDRGADPLRRRGVRALRQGQEEHPRGGADRRLRDDRAGQAGRPRGGHLGVEVRRSRSFWKRSTVAERLEKVYGLMQGEMSVLQVEKKIKTRVKSQMERTQREYYLNEQMKAIQKELGDGEEGGTRSPSSRSGSPRPSSRRRRAKRPRPS
jgi:ATP-dependent Lon protease